MGSCTYTFDPADAETTPAGAGAGAWAGDLDGEWACPHDAHPDADRCVFHLGADRREDLGVEPEDVTDRFLDLFEVTDPEHKRLLGADLPAVHLEYQHLVGESRHPVDLRFSDVDALEFDHTTVENPIDLRGARVGAIDFTEAEFAKRVYFSGARIDGEVTAADAEFDEEVEFEAATFAAPVSLTGAVFGDDVTFDDAAFAAEATFSGAEFHGRSNVRGDNASFAGADFRADAAFDEAVFEFVAFEGATFGSEVTFEAATFDGAASFDDAAFEGLADFDGARFRQNATFRRTAYHGKADFRGAEFQGGAAIQHDDADFEGARFHGPARFGQAEFADADFREVVFADDAVFEGATFREDSAFDDAVFEGLADFDEGRFQEDAAFKRTEYRGTADFRGVEFQGGANVLEDDADFEGARFRGPARFGQAEFAYADFHDAVFGDEADFQEALFDADVDFQAVTFEGLADFDEARFYADGDFAGTTFEAGADFRGVTFLGEARHLEDNARFEGATFRGPVEFDDAAFTSANFRDVTFGGSVDFQRVEFESIDMAAESAGATVYVNMTGADVAKGTISQPEDHWVRYDLTRAHLGAVSLSAASAEREQELFDYFRFLETDFEDFDFSEHRAYLDRNDWELHVFEEAGADYDFSLAATPATIETTYLYAYNNAKAMGDNDAAIEFAIHQAKHRRKKNVGYVRDGSHSVSYRLSKLGDVVGNSLWHLTCGYGYRLWRILVVSVFVVVAWGFMYALPFTKLDNEASLTSVGALFTPEGLATVAQYVYYSLITFTTVGYGDINPVNAAARTLAVTEGILGVLLAALVVFVLGRRVAV